jgi:ATP-dependent exoDNAse (exonuclease V) beta subunit
LTLSDTNCAKLVIERCYNLFSKDDDGKGVDCITLASTHKFKEDERNRVFCLAETYCKASDKQTQDEAQQEKNLLYVAITRAKMHLSYVTGLKQSREAFGQDGDSPL